MKRISVILAAVVLIGLTTGARADVFKMGDGLMSLETVWVGDAGNAADTRYSSPGFGAVGYSYQIGKYEVTAAQYCDFLNAKAKTDTHGLYNPAMLEDFYGCQIQQTGSPGEYRYSVASDYANRPVNYVSYWDACRFANWLDNGQEDGDTETGTYDLSGYNGADGRNIHKNAGTRWAIPSENNWYKAAYYKGNGTDSGYWDYPTQSDSIPSNELGDPIDPGNNATFWNNGFTIGYPYYRTEVGAHENSESAYGTYDQGGNIWEWNSTIISEGTGYANRGLRGGSPSGSYSALSASSRGSNSGPAGEGYFVGFRVAMVPEPPSLMVLAGGLASLVGLRRRRA